MRYVMYRILQAIILLKLVLISVFLLVRLTGDPATVMAPDGATMEDIESLRRQFGFDDPLFTQYKRFFGGVLRGDFGFSVEHRLPVMELELDHLPATLELAFTAYLFSILIAFPAGILSTGAGRKSIWERGCLLGTAFAQSMPEFWLGLMLILLFAVQLGWLPAFGRGGISHLILPALSTSVFLAGRLTRLIRTGLLEAMGQEYVTTARAKGLRELRILCLHAMRNASLPLVTLLGTDFGVLLGGTVVTEVVFAYPGVGLLTVQAIYHRDFAIVQATVFFLATFFVVINLVVDLTYGFLDPRVRLSKF